MSPVRSGGVSSSTASQRSRPYKTQRPTKPPTEPPTEPSTDSEDDQLDTRESLALPGEDFEGFPLDDELKPVRLLDHFVFHDRNTKKCNETLHVLLEFRNPVGKGLAAAVDTSNEDDEALQWVELDLSSVWRFWVDHHELDSGVWVETSFAWYKLVSPAPEYRDAWVAFIRPVFLAKHLYTIINKCPQLPVEEFVGRLHSIPLPELVTAPYTEEDLQLEGFVSEVMHGCLPRQEKLPLIKHILRGHGIEEDHLFGDNDLSRTPPPLRRRDGAATEPLTVTPVVAQLARRWLGSDCKLRVVGSAISTAPPSISGIPAEGRSHVGYLNTSDEEYFPDSQTLLRKLKLGGVLFQVHDVIEYNSTSRSGESKLRLGRVMWIGASNYMFHVQRLEPMGTTVRSPTFSEPNELVLLSRWHDVFFHHIRRRVRVDFGRDFSAPQSCRFVYDPNDMSYTSLPKIDYNQAVCPCATCATTLDICTIGDTRQHDGTSYHVRDFVRVRSEDGGLCWITQVVALKGKTPRTFLARPLGRVRERFGGVSCNEDYFFCTQEVYEFDWLLVLGKAVIRHRLSDHRDPCDGFVDARLETLNSSWHSRQHITPSDIQECRACSNTLASAGAGLSLPDVRILDLCAGTGGFSAAFIEGLGFGKVTDAIDNNEDAVHTMRSNHKGLRVHLKDIGDALSHAVDSTRRGDIEQLAGDFDVITVSLPCQDHSLLNRNRTSMSSRNLLLFTALSYVEYFRPRYLLFENVPQFLHSTLGGAQNGFLKVLLQGLHLFRYQTRFAVLCAAHYGTPQRRSRFVLIAAREDQPLPDMPAPTHELTTSHSNLPKGLRLKHFAPAPGCALYPGVSIQDAIGDLPGFDWDPAKKTPVNSAARDLNYARKPTTAFQRRCRSPTTKLTLHSTMKYSKRVTKLTTLIPTVPGASLDNIPKQHKANIQHMHARKKRTYARLAWDDQFHTVVTNVSPEALQPFVLHPESRRVYTVRELARAQGFPDSFHFTTVHDRKPKALRKRYMAIHRLIGNAVPWPLGRALGKALSTVMRPGSCENPFVVE